MEDLNVKIKEFALENAVKFKGKATKGAIVGKLMSLDVTIKSRMQEVNPLIDKIIEEVNSMDLESQTKLLLELNPNFTEQQEDKKKENKEKRSDLPELKNAEMGKVVTRIAPEPSKYNHVGHALSFGINYMYAQKYNGKTIIKFDDTNPEKESQEYVDAMQADVIDYMDIKPAKVIYASDSNDKLLEMTQKLVDENQTYTCCCAQEEISGHRRNMTECKCRSKDLATIKKEWEEMKKGNLPEGTITLRLKIDMAHKNAVMRDPVIYRLCYTPHYRQKDKYKVWPMYDYDCPILDALEGVTHILRSNEFESRIELQDYIRNLFNLTHPTIKQYARFSIVGALTQGRDIRAKIESGEYIGWDDPRLVTLRALKRRGIVKETYYEFAKVVGMSKTNSEIDFSVIASINRRILDATTSRFFAIMDPVKIKVSGAPVKDIQLHLHPDHPNIGNRHFKINEEYYLEKSDVDKFEENEMVRLIDNINFVYKKEDDSIYDSDDYMTFKSKGKNIIQFLPAVETEHVHITVLMPDNIITTGIAEKNIKTLKVGDVIQFQRFGFCRLDSIKDGKYNFWYTHD